MRGREHEVDLIVERDDGEIVALEVKLAAAPVDSDVRHSHRLKERLGADVLDMGS